MSGYTTVPSHTILSPGPSSVPLVVKGSAGQIADLQQWQDSNGTTMARVDALGNLTLIAGSGNFVTFGQVTAGSTSIGSAYLNVLDTSNPTVVRAIIRGATSQSADLQQWQNSTPTTLAKVKSNGSIQTPALQLTGAGTPTVTVGAGAGTGATASVNANSTDTRGIITVNVGTGPAAGLLATLNFSATLSPTPVIAIAIWYGPNVGTQITIDNLGATSFQIKCTALAASTTYQIQYLVLA